MNDLCSLIYNSPIGKIQIVGNEKYVTQIKLGGKANVRNREKIYPHLKKCQKQLQEYFEGGRTLFDIPLLFEGTDFQKKVWAILTDIPYGKTLNYGDVASILGNKNKARAVGGACNKNNLLIVVPCHRVVGSQGLTGFACGINKKKFLLKHETSSN